MDGIGQECAPSGFDIIIDDASHVGAPTWASFWHLFDHHLKPGGIYCIEDWRVGYWPDWADGASYEPPKLGTSFFDKTWRVRSHDAGLVGVVKALVDELGADMIALPKRGGSGEHRLPRFARLEITPGQAFVVKATREDDDLGWPRGIRPLALAAPGRGPGAVAGPALAKPGGAVLAVRIPSGNGALFASRRFLPPHGSGQSHR